MKLFDYECTSGHVTEQSFGHLDKIPDEIGCPVCSKEHPDQPPVMAKKVLVYGLKPVRMPSGPGGSGY
jgi:hypothetical protein